MAGARVLQPSRSSRPRRFSKGIKSIKLGFVSLLNVSPADFHGRREAVVLDGEEVVCEM